MVGEGKKLTEEERELASAILQSPVTEQGMVVDPVTEKALGVCEAVTVKDEEDCVLINLKMTCFKPLDFLEVNIDV